MFPALNFASLAVSPSKSASTVFVKSKIHSENSVSVIDVILLKAICFSIGLPEKLCSAKSKLAQNEYIFGK